jgi:hypothetical protein
MESDGGNNFFCLFGEQNDGTKAGIRTKLLAGTLPFGAFAHPTLTQKANSHPKRDQKEKKSESKHIING